MFRPPAEQFTTPIRVLKRHETNVNGALDISYIDADPAVDVCNWKSKGGTVTFAERMESGTLTVLDTADVTMWYRPDISQKDRLYLNDDNTLAYDIIGPPENVEMRNMFLLLKVKRAVNA